MVVRGVTYTFMSVWYAGGHVWTASVIGAHTSSLSSYTVRYSSSLLQLEPVVGV